MRILDKLDDVRKKISKTSSFDTSSSRNKDDRKHKKKKGTFIQIVLPLILKENNNIKLVKRLLALLIKVKIQV